MKTITIMFLAAVPLAVGCGGSHAKAGAATTPMTGSPVSKDDARAIALRQVPGTVTNEESEQEHGGSVYSFEIKPDDGSAAKEVEIDATSGKVLEVEDADGDDEGEDEGDDDHEGDGDHDD